MSALAMHTNHIGFMVTATTTYEEPYLLARRLGSLDHISKGRSSWNVVTTSYPGDAVNFGTAKHPPHALRYERAREFVDVCKGLWDSWAPDAFPQDRATGQFLDPTKVRTLNHMGKHFQVKGPLNVARLPQGYPVFFMAGQSEPGREFAAYTADCVFSVNETKESAQKFYADVKGRMHKYGRRPEDMRIVPGAAVYIGRTAAEADEFYEELQSLISPVLGVAYLSKLTEMDLSKVPLDGPMPTEPPETTAITGMRDNILEIAKAEKLTVRQTYERILPSQGHVTFKGTPKQIADQMEDWYTSQACDGFNVQTPVLPRSLNEFVDLVIPELQRRGLFRKEYTGKTLRENMGLPVPQNPYFGNPAVAAE
jgi:alkanesulfonate monooxygenase